MGYTVYYQGCSDTPLTPEQRKIVTANVAKWSVRLSESAEDYSWEYEDDGCQLSGFTKPGMDADDMDADINVLIAAVRELQAALQNVKFTVSDDYDLELFP